MIAPPHRFERDMGVVVCDVCDGPLGSPRMYLGPHPVTRIYHVVCSMACFRELVPLLMLTVEHGNGEHRG